MALQQLSEDRKWLKQRLLRAKGCLGDPARKAFAPWKFDFRKKQLKGKGVVLQWQTRLHPTRPVSYRNQQTSIGIVVLKRR